MRRGSSDRRGSRAKARKVGAKNVMPPTRPNGGSSEVFDVVILSDITDCDIGTRVAAEAAALATADLRVGLRHMPSRGGGGRISTRVLRLVRAGGAAAIDQTANVRTALLVVYIGDGSADISAQLRNVAADRVVVVADRSPEADVGRVAAEFAGFGKVSFAATNPWARAALEAAGAKIEVEPENWPLVASAPQNGRRPETVDAPVTIGLVGGAKANQWPATRDELEQVLPFDGSVNVILLGRPPKHLMPQKVPRGWRVFGEGEVAIDWFLREIDVLACFPAAEATDIPDAIVASAMAAGKAVVLETRLQGLVGDGAICCGRGETRETIGSLIANPGAREEAGARAREAAGRRFSPKRYLDRVRALLGRRPKTRRGKASARSAPAPHAPSPSAPTAIFLASNGIGLGHVARLLAIARRADGRFRPVFATMAQAAHIIGQFGYHAEYIPSLMYTGAPPIAWDDWLGFELERLIDGYDARLVVYDGNELPAGLLRAIMARGEVKLAWVRRGMGEKDPLPPVETARFCDIVIEPGEIAAPVHFVGMARKRRGMVTVDPIRLLDDDEALQRDEAAAALGLDPAKPAVLIHLDSGSNRDITHAIDVAVRTLRGFPDVQVAIAEWANAPAELALWPEATIVRGFPLARYYNAFDFSIGAAGYNSFHEAIGLALPTVFVANVEPGMDDQIGRARYAQDAGAAIELPESEFFRLEEICRILLSAKARDVLRENCRKLGRNNGAADAAQLIGALA
jgi:UDP:flavonoid glycosyltransferase YjiC (YdhE family)